MTLRKPNLCALLVIVYCAFSVCAHGQSFSKLSAHLINAYTVGSSNIVSGKPQLLKVLALDSGFPSGMVQAMRDYKTKVPNGKIIVRVYSPKMYVMTNDPTASANDFWNTIIQPALNSIGASDRALIDYMEGPNEGQTPTIGYPFDQQVQASQWLNQFWTNLTPTVVAAGMKPCIGSISVGNIDPFSLLSYFVPALRQAKAAGGGWSYHAYTVQYSTDVSTEIWWSLRYRQFYTYFAQNFPDLVDMSLILTEGGVDQSGDPLTSGWQARGTAAQYERWLNWFDYQMRQDSYLLGCTLFENGDSSGWPSFELEPITGWFHGYLLDPTNAPPIPVGLSANGSNLLKLTWTNSPLNPTTYNIKRSNNPGGPYSVIARNVTEGVSNVTFTDTNALSGVTYYYVVSALNNFGESDDSIEVSGTAAPPKINCSGGTVGAFTDDTYFSGGLTFSTTTTIDTNGVVNPAPVAVYETQRYQTMTYVIPNLAPSSYKVRLHFAEVYFSSSGQRLFNVKINGATVLSSFDIFAAAGGQFKANVQEFNAIPDAAGRITIDFITVLNNAACNGIEIVANPTTSIPAAPGGLSAAVGPGNITL
ncbi:MAG: malectin domain-containing carbohydrate-binding protein, partial [Limisphaerales bacterium]